MLIYCNGDSFTAGSELADDLLPKWPGYFSTSEKSRIKEDFVNFKNRISTKHVDIREVDNHNIIELPKIYDNATSTAIWSVGYFLTIAEKQRAWPAQLTKLDPSIEIINAARGGAGMVGICQRSVVDLIKLRNQGKQVDLVIIQLTGFFRPEIYDKNVHDFMYEQPIMAEKEYWFNEYDFDIAQAIARKYTDLDELIKYLYTLCSAVEAIKSLTGKYPILVDAVCINNLKKYLYIIEEHYKIRNNPEELERFYTLKQGSQVNNIFPTSISDIAFRLAAPYCVQSHYSVETHRIFATEIHKNLIKLQKEY